MGRRKEKEEGRGGGGGGGGEREGERERRRRNRVRKEEEKRRIRQALTERGEGRSVENDKQDSFPFACRASSVQAVPLAWLR